MTPGAQASVFLAEHEDGDLKEKVVFKCFLVEEEDKDRLEEQIIFWKKLCLKNSHIVLLKGFHYYFQYAKLKACLYSWLCAYVFYINFFFVCCTRYDDGVL
jgi:hypothetical protein